MIEIQNFIGGVFQKAVSGISFDNINPSNGRIYGTIPDSDAQDVEQAVQAAQSAQKAWAETSADRKFEILNNIAVLIRQNLDQLALAECIDNGKPLWLAKKVDIPRAAANFEFFATAVKHYTSESYANPPDVISTTLRQPVGIVGCISPWNLPLYLFTWKIAPALAAGNCVIAKPSEITPMTAYLLGDICIQAGLPQGVLNIVHGTGPKVGAAIVEHPLIKAISFTGGTATGKQIIQTAGPMFKKLSLELGGKNPAIIMDDCDYDRMIRETIRSSFANQGQICLCTSRLLIHESIYDKFKSDFVAIVDSMTVGDPLQKEKKIDQGSIVSEVHFNKILNSIEIAKSEGGKILTGGNKVTLDGELRDGFYIRPTVIEGLGPDSQTNQEEIFGPVVTLQKFSNTEEAIALANNTKYGLASVIWSKNTDTIHRLSQELDTGIVWVNCWLVRDLRTPFGGVKQSGIGREGGWDAMKFFTEVKSVTQVF